MRVMTIFLFVTSQFQPLFRKYLKSSMLLQRSQNFLHSAASSFTADDSTTLCETYCPDPTLPHADTLYPISDQLYPPLIHHIKTQKSWGKISDLIADQCRHLSTAYVNELICFGSVYLSVPNSKSTLQSPKGSPGKRVDGMSKTARVLSTDTAVPKGSYCRVHVNPRRYPLAHSVDWSKRIYTNSFTDYVFVNKIAGVPTVPTVDNQITTSCATSYSYHLI